MSMAAVTVTAAAEHYAKAHAAHYADGHLVAAVRAYEQIIASHPGAPEAEYSREQVRNIVRAVVPAADVLAAHMDLVLRHAKPDG